ncbi:MAG: glucose-6-phosphate isomerase, partial [Planctomycetota bacterium]
MTTEAKLTALGSALALKEGVPLATGEGLQFEFPGGCLDLTRHLIDADVLTTLLEHAEAKQLCESRDAMFAGERINTSEDRAVLHVALRGGIKKPIHVDGEDPVGYATEQLDRMLVFADAIRNGKVQAPSGVPFTDVVNIGIGGSDLGPRMAAEALRANASGPRVHFVANVDGHDFELVTRELDPKTTLCLVASKTFTTLETMMNARTARSWIAQAVGEDCVGAHFAALSTNAEAVREFGIDPDRMFGFRDWVGGRFSMWSPIGLSLACAIGSKGVRELLAGAAAMDHHFA